MMTAATLQTMTAEQFLAWEETQQEKHEFIAGEVFAMAGVSRKHATTAGNLFRFFANQMSGTPCRVYMADMRLQLAAADAFFYPDVFVACAAADHQAEHFITDPRLSLEVLSEMTEAYDRGHKFAHYRRFPSLDEYVLVDPSQRKTEIFRRDPTGLWVLYEYDGDEPVQFASLELTLASQDLFESV